MSSREDKMVVVSRKADGTPDVWCDPEIMDIVTALNAAGIRTISSCSGHGHRPGYIVFADGRWLILPRDEAEARVIQDAFPIDINGEFRPRSTRPVEGKAGGLLAVLPDGEFHLSKLGKPIGFSQKEVYNCISYLTQRGLVERRGRGRYFKPIVPSASDA